MTAVDLFLGLAVCVVALACAWRVFRRFPSWFPLVWEVEVAGIAARALLTMLTMAAVGLTLSWWRIEAGMVPAGHGNLDEFRGFLIPVVGLLLVSGVAMQVLERALARR